MATNNYNSVNWLKLIKWLEIYIYIHGKSWRVREDIGEDSKGGMEGWREGGRRLVVNTKVANGS